MFNGIKFPACRLHAVVPNSAVHTRSSSKSSLKNIETEEKILVASITTDVVQRGIEKKKRRLR